MEDLNKLMMPTPTNLKAGRVYMVDSDLYNICERIKEVDRNLFLVYHERHAEPWVVMEHCADGADRLVSRYAELDSRILDNLRYMLAVPFEKRLEEMQKRIDRENAENVNKIDEAEWEKFLWKWDKAARKSNLYDPVWDKSYRNIKPKGGKNGSDKN